MEGGVGKDLGHAHAHLVGDLVGDAEHDGQHEVGLPQHDGLGRFFLQPAEVPHVIVEPLIFGVEGGGGGSAAFHGVAGDDHEQAHGAADTRRRPRPGHDAEDDRQSQQGDPAEERLQLCLLAALLEEALLVDFISDRLPPRFHGALKQGRVELGPVPQLGQADGIAVVGCAEHEIEEAGVDLREVRRVGVLRVGVERQANVRLAAVKGPFPPDPQDAATRQVQQGGGDIAVPLCPHPPKRADDRRWQVRGNVAEVPAREAGIVFAPVSAEEHDPQDQSARGECGDRDRRGSAHSSIGALPLGGRGADGVGLGRPLGFLGHDRRHLGVGFGLEARETRLREEHARLDERVRRQPIDREMHGPHGGDGDESVQGAVSPGLHLLAGCDPR